MTQEPLPDCPLCGAPLGVAPSGCGRCPMHSDCGSLCCPRCGYRTAVDSRLTRFLRKWLRKEYSTFQQNSNPLPCTEAFPLREMPPGTQGRIVHIASDQESRLARLSSLGLVPGCRIRLCQRHPATIVEIGETTLALGKDLVESIYVEPDAEN